MSRFFFAFIALFLSGCGHEVAPTYPYTQKFDRLAKAHNRYVATTSIAIEIADLGSEKEKIDCSQKKVTISSDVWADTRDGAREAAVFHVLAHCLLRRGHRPGDMVTGSAISEPWSLMNSDFVQGPIYLSDDERFTEELFTVPVLNDTVYP